MFDGHTIGWRRELSNRGILHREMGVPRKNLIGVMPPPFPVDIRVAARQVTGAFVFGRTHTRKTIEGEGVVHMRPQQNESADS